jgi:peptidoglycan hydrolase-like protein with peptidoglycan-binding domain
VKRSGRVALATVAVLGVGGGAVAVFGFPHEPSQAAADSDLPPATGTVTRETLVDAQDEDGQTGYGDTTKVTGSLQGTLTALPATGTVLTRGKAIYRVDDTPVVLLYGSLPAYRVLKTGEEGADVRQLEQNLYALGYRGFTVDDTYSAATADAVRDWQEDLGLTGTGTVEPGRIRYAPGPVRVNGSTAAVGDTLQPGGELMEITGTAQLVTVEMSVDDQRLAKTGGTVRITLPNGSEATGRIVKTETVIVPAQGQEPASTKLVVTISVADQKALAGVQQASVRVSFTASERPDVLTVPVAALLALAEGGYGVQVVEGSSTRIVAVETGLFAGGRVEVTGSGLKEGMKVGMPS